MVRIAYALGGLGSGIVYNKDELVEKARRAFTFTNQILIEESLKGWKEVEYEIIRDKFNNCITICSMENIDPMGIHTGDSIVIAPVQTLSASENFKLRSIGIKLIRHLGVVGECNIQYALDPHSDDYRIIEVNARLSRSSALASKATGYPLAFIATKLALGYALNEVVNIITQETSACFEPALDYVALKFPRWDLQKFRQVSTQLGSEMKSVGEVMSLGRSFEEVIQKAIRMLDIGMKGFVGNSISFGNLDKELSEPTDKRMYAIAEALKQGYSVEKIHKLTGITEWFIHKMQNIIATENKLRGRKLNKINFDMMLEAKKNGFSDIQIGQIVEASEFEVRNYRKSLKVTPVVKQIDTLAAEYPAQTNYLYLTYHGKEDDISLGQRNQVVVLGSGAYRIGSSVEFDWCCVNAVMTLNKLEYDTIMINCNPETVSTDYDICDKLYFEQLTFERVLDIYDKENPEGVIISMGGQVPNNLAVKLHNAGVKIVGTSPSQIDNAEDRHKFSQILDRLEVDQPEWKELTGLSEAKEFAEKVGYPVLIRPSYVLSGAAMSIVISDDELEQYLKKASEISKDHPVVISKFITDAREIEVDAVADDGNLFCYAISEHVENAGVHSGDATIVLPPQRTYLETMRRVKMVTRQIARELKITGPFNIQFIAKDNEVKVIECNLRASRSMPFVSKVLKTNLIDQATKIMLKIPIEKPHKSIFDLDYIGCKAPQFSFSRLKKADPVLGVDMSSTGEVGCIGDNYYEAILKAMLSVGYTIPKKNILLSTGDMRSKVELVNSCRMLTERGYNLFATHGTHEFLRLNGIESIDLAWPDEDRKPNVMEYLKAKEIDLVVNIPKDLSSHELSNDYSIRRGAVDYNIPLLTNARLASAFIYAICKMKMEDISIKSWDEY